MRVFYSGFWHLFLPHRFPGAGGKSAGRSSWRLLAQTSDSARIAAVPERPGPGQTSRCHDLFDARQDAGKREKTQMFHLHWFRCRGINRGKPGLPGGHGRRLALLGFLIASSLTQTGCQSGPFSPCGFVGRTTAFITRPFRHGCNSCGGCEGVAEGGCVSSGVPVGVTAAPMVVTPGARSAPVLQRPPTFQIPPRSWTR